MRRGDTRSGFFALGVALLVTACGGPTFVAQRYDGPQRPRESIAIVRLNANDDARLATLDGEKLPLHLESDVRVHIEVLPGEHEALVLNAQQRNAPAQRVRFVTRAGRVYRATLSTPAGAPVGLTGEPQWVPRVYEVDRDGDELLADVTVPAAAGEGARGWP